MTQPNSTARGIDGQTNRSALRLRIERLEEALRRIKFEAHPASALSSHVNVQALVRIERLAGDALAEDVES